MGASTLAIRAFHRDFEFQIGNGNVHDIYRAAKLCVFGWETHMSWFIAAATTVIASITPQSGLAASPSFNAQTCQEAMAANWKSTVAAFEDKRYAEAKASAAKLAVPCQSDAVARPLLATFTANIDITMGKPQEAIATLDLAPPPETSRLWITSRFIYLAAFKALGDDARFKAGRDQLIATNEARMLAGDYWMKQEHFETPLASVDAYRRRTKPGEPNDTLFIATPKAAVMPVSYQVNEGGLVGLIGALSGDSSTRDEIGDLNECETHASLTPTKPNYAAWRAKAVELFSDSKVIGNESGAGADVCSGWTFILPGLSQNDGGEKVAK